VDAPYEYAPHRHAGPSRTIAHEDGPWVQMQTETNRQRVSRELQVYPPRRYDLGTLRRGTQDRTSPAFDSLAQWMEGDGFIEARIPWTMLNVTDPSSRHVLQDPVNPAWDEHAAVVTPGFRACLVHVSGTTRPKVLETVPEARRDGILIPPLFVWPTWEQPRWHSYRKRAFDSVKNAFAALPDSTP
jgi:hypothetical protein